MSLSTQEYLFETDGYFNEFIEADNNIINQGFVDLDLSSEFRKGGFIKESVFRIPIQDIGITRTFIANEDTVVTPNKIDSYKVRSVMVSDGFALEASNFVGIKQGQDAMGILRPYAAAARDIARGFAQEDLKSISDANLKTGGALESHYSKANLSINAGVFSIKEFQKFLTSIYGEKKAGYNFNLVTSQYVIDRLLELGIAQLNNQMGVSPSGVIVQGNINGVTASVLGMPLIPNDVFGIKETVDSKEAYPIYAMAGTPFGVEYQTNFLLTTDYIANKGQGTWEMYFYGNHAPTLKGLSYVKDELDVLSDLAVSANWSKRWNSRNIKIAKYLIGGESA